MNRITAIAFVSTATFIMLGSTVAAAQTLEVKIPFAFIVRKQVLPAGTYRISSLGANLVQIGTRDKRAVEMSTTYFNNKEARSDGRLVFAKYGDQYFLREILCDSPAINAALPASNLEKLARIREARLRSAAQTIATVR